MRLSVPARLSTMMFLEFFVWGGWFVTAGSYLANNLSASGVEIATAYSTQSWGAILAPFVIGLIADRYFHAERILGVLHIVGGILMYLLADATEFSEFFPYLLAYMILFMPTLALVNSISFSHLDDPSREFGAIRVWGTIGWIVAGLAISFAFSWDSTAAIADGELRNTFLMCSVGSFLLGIYSFTLPGTPPKAAGRERASLGEILGFEALVLLKNRNFLIFFVASILICIPLAFYYQHANQFLTEIEVDNATGIQTLGQVSEVLFMLLIPLFLKRYGMKATLLIGMAAWALRYALFSFGNADSLLFMLIGGIVLHGVCYDFFFVSGQIYTDARAGKSYRSAAQGLITLATYGLGMLVGFWAAGLITDFYAVEGGHDWQSIWLFPAVFAVAVLAVFAASFKNERIHYGS